MRKLSKPDFSSGGGWVSDLPGLSDEALKELRRCLPRGMSAADSDDFLDSCGAAFRRVAAMADVEPAGSRKKVLDQLADRARALLQELNGVSSETVSSLAAHFDEVLPDRDEPSANDFLDEVWTTVSALEELARYGSSQAVGSRQDRPSENNARRLVLWVAQAYERVAGRRPPYSKGTWFPEFIEVLGREFEPQLRCGRALVESVIRER